MRLPRLFAAFLGLLLATACEGAPKRPEIFFLATQKLRDTADLPAAATLRSTAIDGVFIRIAWSSLQPTRDSFDWRLLDAVAKQAVSSGKVLSIGVIAGEESPSWLADAGVPTLEMTIARRRCRTISVAVPWSPAYISRYLGMMAEVKKHLVEIGAFDSVRNVKLTAIAQHTLELRLPRNNRCSSTVDAKWASLGYRPSRVVNAWSQVADQVAAFFPHSLIVQPILQAQGFPAIDENGNAIDHKEVRTGDQIISRCIAKFKARCGVQWNALKLTGRMAERVIDAHRDGATIGWQTNLYEGPRVGVGCQVDRRAPTLNCTESDYAKLLRRGIELGGSFIEVWEPDVQRFPGAFAAARRGG